MKCKAKKAFFAGKNDIYHRWKEVKKLNGKSKNQYYNRKPQWLSCRRFLTCIPLKVIPLRCWTMS